MKNKSALGIKYLHPKNFFSRFKICYENEKPTTYQLNRRRDFNFTSHHPVRFSGNRLCKINI